MPVNSGGHVSVHVGEMGSIVESAIVIGVLQILAGRELKFSQVLVAGIKRLIPVIGVSLICGFLVVFGFVLFIVPGIMALCALYATVPVVVIERQGVFASIRRSRELTKGFRWRIFGIMLLSALISIPPCLLIFIFAGTPFFAVMPTLITLVWLIVEVAFSAVLQAVAYAGMRIANGEVDAGRIAFRLS
jgi:uncharacterized membrane protein